MRIHSVLSIERLNIAKQLMNGDLNNEEYRRVIYENIYTASRFASTSFLFLENYRAKRSSRYHETLLLASENIFKEHDKLDNDTKKMITVLHRIRKRRNDIDYDEMPSDISEQGLNNAINIVEKWIEKIRGFIAEKENSKNLV